MDTTTTASPRLSRVGTSSTVSTQGSNFSFTSRISRTSTAATSIAESLQVPPPAVPLRNVFSFDGGGVRGVFGALVLEAVQEQLDTITEERGVPCVPINDKNVAHEAIGTSAGALTTIMFALMGLPPAVIITYFLAFSEAIFRYKRVIPLWMKRLPWNWAQRRCSSTQMRAAISDLLRDLGYEPDVALSSFAITAPDVAIVTVDTSNADDAVLLCNTADSTWTVCDAAMASTAAPLLMKPVSHNGKTYIDGAFKANNPSPHIRTPVNEVNVLLSIGTGNQNIELPATPSLFGIFKTVRALGHKVSSPRDADRETRRVFEAVGRGERYVRIEPPADIANIRLNDWRGLPGFVERSRVWLKSPEVVEKLRRVADFIETNLRAQEQLC
ncbi:FabD/lysophospholipase-like protein [Exidia glandulosa HHB12029]|uniref:FabD/lysophospholipase-like protein n=1 Tax=Exidia glandulosa HHB12029 TaxID=1314781 RepID=A0A166ASR1_EXIGL|nr:FabD/lysophospholipase-like protein [Exidia glandulosa HHB12029]